MTMTTDDLETTEYLERLARLEPSPTVDEEARWILTVAGARAIDAPVSDTAFWDELAVWHRDRLDPTRGWWMGMPR